MFNYCLFSPLGRRSEIDEHCSKGLKTTTRYCKNVLLMANQLRSLFIEFQHHPRWFSRRISAINSIKNGCLFDTKWRPSGMSSPKLRTFPSQMLQQLFDRLLKAAFFSADATGGFGGFWLLMRCYLKRGYTGICICICMLCNVYLFVCVFTFGLKVQNGLFFSPLVE